MRSAVAFKNLNWWKNKKNIHGQLQVAKRHYEVFKTLAQHRQYQNASAVQCDLVLVPGGCGSGGGRGGGEAAPAAAAATAAAAAAAAAAFNGRPKPLFHLFAFLRLLVSLP